MPSPETRKRNLITRKFFGLGLRPDISRYAHLHPALDEAARAVSTEYQWADVWEEGEDRSILLFSRDEVIRYSLRSDLKGLTQAEVGHLFRIPA